MLPWILCVILIITVIILTIKISVMKKSMTEILRGVEELLQCDTNTLISVSSSDRTVRRLAGRLNRELRSLRRLKRQYETGDRELKDAVTNISHDLRTPLTAICGYLELLEYEEKSENVKRYVGQIANRTEALKALTEELFRYSVIASTPALTLESINICRVLEETLISFYGAMKKENIVPSVTMPELPVYRQVDASALSRVFGNILGNAVKYSDGDLDILLTDDGCVTFSNTAKELSTVDVGKLFDRFYTVDTARHSTGLGLSIAKLLCERMNGEIKAEYKDGRLYIILKL